MAQSANNTVQAAINTAETYRTGLPTAQIWESNRKTLYAMWVKRAKAEELVDSERAQVRSIANQCPLQGGGAVREMPLLLPLPEAYDYSVEDYWYACVDVVSPRGDVSKTAASSNSALSIYPNPANDQIILSLAQPQAGNWRIMDVSGRVWRRGSTAEGQHTVSVATADMPSGIYFCLFDAQSGIRLTQRFILQR